MISLRHQQAPMTRGDVASEPIGYPVKLSGQIARGQASAIDNIVHAPSACRNSACGFLDHLPEALLIEPGTVQDRGHHIVVEHLVERRLIRAVVGASVHGPLLDCIELSTIGAKGVLIVSRIRGYRGNRFTNLPLRL